jgi:hypothetical protein
MSFWVFSPEERKRVLIHLNEFNEKPKENTGIWSQNELHYP